jgi:hypothetical protein
LNSIRLCLFRSGSTFHNYANQQYGDTVKRFAVMILAGHSLKINTRNSKVTYCNSTIISIISATYIFFGKVIYCIISIISATYIFFGKVIYYNSNIISIISATYLFFGNVIYCNRNVISIISATYLFFGKVIYCNSNIISIISATY